MKVKGIVLAGGAGTRLYPLTSLVCKQLLPVYDKPMVYYPISTLMLSGIRDILIISTPQDIPSFKKILGDGSHLGLRFEYSVQDKPKGIAQSFIIGESFIGKDRVCLILGDNIFYGNLEIIREGMAVKDGGIIFAYRVRSPERYGVVEFDKKGNALGIEEKPSKPKSTYAITGLYVYGSEVVDIAKSIKPSNRGELEITDVNQVYLQRKALTVKRFYRGMAWLDTGTQQSLLEASNFIHALDERQGLKLGCIEEVAFRMGYINKREFQSHIESLGECPYKSYLQNVVDGV
jgi:glucose-1-phosphate thymidylyltransferase